MTIGAIIGIVYGLLRGEVAGHGGLRGVLYARGQMIIFGVVGAFVGYGIDAVLGVF